MARAPQYRKPPVVDLLNNWAKSIAEKGGIVTAGGALLLAVWYFFNYILHWAGDGESGLHDSQVRQFCAALRDQAVRPSLDGSRYDAHDLGVRWPSALNDIDDCRNVWEHGWGATFSSGIHLWLGLFVVFVLCLLTAGLWLAVAQIIARGSLWQHKRRVAADKQRREQLLADAQANPYHLENAVIFSRRRNRESVPHLEFDAVNVDGSGRSRLVRPLDEMRWLAGGSLETNVVIFPNDTCNEKGVGQRVGPVVVFSEQNVFNLQPYVPAPDPVQLQAARLREQPASS